MVDATTDQRHHDAVALAAAHERRLVPLAGVFNFRDLGGYPAAGGYTRWEQVYRADGLHRLTADDVDLLRRRGLGTVIDLRTDTELAERGTFPLDRHAVEFHHLPIVDRTWHPGEVPDYETSHEFLVWAYHDMLDAGADKLVTGLELIAASDTPVVFHCAAGKDRTGLLAALLLSTLGVPPEFVAADYAKTTEAMVKMRAAWAAWAAEQGIEPDSDEQERRRHYFDSPATAMTEVLATITADHGSVADFVTTLGVRESSIARLRERLVDRAG